jgi:hypothetical protein
MNVFIESHMPGIINGSVFVDFNANSMPDTLEGIENVLIQLFADANTDGVADSGTPMATQMTTAIGAFSFTLVTTGSYVLVEQQPSGYSSVKDFDASNDSDIVPNTNIFNDTIPVTITNGELDEHNYFIDEPDCGLTVSNTNDADVGSLRYVIDCAVDGDTINFHSSLSGLTIEINSSSIVIDKDIVIYSTLAPRITISSQVNGLFVITPDAAVEFRSVDMISGLSPGNTGAAIDNSGMVKLFNVNVIKNPLFVSGQYLIQNFPGSELTILGSCYIEKD